MKTRFVLLILTASALLSISAEASDVKVEKKAVVDDKSNQVFISKSDVLYGESPLSSVVVQTVIKSFPLNIPPSSGESNEDSVAD